MKVRETRAELLEAVFAPRSIAVVGASPKGGWGLQTLSNLQEIGFGGRLSVVHPTASEVLGVQTVPSLADLDYVPDAVALSVPATAVLDVLQEACDLGVRGAVSYASGFAEMGKAGVAQQRAIAEVVDGRMALVGPNCLGAISFRNRSALWASILPSSDLGTKGRIALASQSGNLALTLLTSARLPALGYAVTLGNQASVDLNDCLEYFISDPELRVVALVAEGISDLQRFRRLARRAAERDLAIVVLKVGRSRRGSEAALAHTGTLAGSSAAYDAVFDETAVVRVDDLEEMVATCSLLVAPQRTQGRSLALFASSGGECGLLADLAEEADLDLAEIDPATADRLRPLLPAYGYISNPFDLTAGAWGQQDVYQSVAESLASVPDVDFVAFVGDAPTDGASLTEAQWPEMLAGVGAAGRNAQVTVALMTSATEELPGLPALCQSHDVTLLAGFRTAFNAIAKVGARSRRLEGLSEDAPVPPAVASEAASEARAILDRSGTVLMEADAKAILSLYGIQVPAGATGGSAEEAVTIADGIGYPVVCKLVAIGVAHKSDIGGVIVGLETAEDVHAAAGQVLDRGRLALGSGRVEGVRIEAAADVANGVELIVGGRNEASGSVVVIGAGGVLTELLADARTLLWPFGTGDVIRSLKELRVHALLDGYRGGGVADLEVLADQVVRIGQLLNDLPEIAELDVNPLLCGLRRKEVVALDALIRQSAKH